MGGEEFLLVLTGMSGTQAVYLVDDVRRTIAAHDGRNRVHVDSTTVLAERRSFRDGRPVQ
jgi:GGDEF domain-containing protein